MIQPMATDASTTRPIPPPFIIFGLQLAFHLLPISSGLVLADRATLRGPQQSQSLHRLAGLFAIRRRRRRNARDRPAVLGDDKALAFFGTGDQLGELGLRLVGTNLGGVAIRFVVAHGYSD